ncbi:hypothetical protein RUND412_004440 [Rhizina undulata]
MSASEVTLARNNLANTLDAPRRDEKKGSSSTGPVDFWDPELRGTRKKLLKRWGAMTAFLALMIFMLLSLYWGALVRSNVNMPSLTVLVVDFDSLVAPYQNTTPIVGPLITQLALAQNSNPGPNLGYYQRSPAEFNNDPMEVRRQIYENKYWAGIVINSNATALLMNTVANGNSSYDPSGAAQIYYVQARQENAINSYVLPQISNLQGIIASEFGDLWIPQVVANMTNATIRQNVAVAPQVLNPAIDFSVFNLVAFDLPVETPAVTVGLIYLIIFSFFAFSFYMPIHALLVTPDGHRPLKFNRWIIYRILATLSAYFFLSLAYSLVSLAYGVPFTRPSSPMGPREHSTRYFPLYWVLNYIGMMAFGLPCENLGMVLGVPWTAMWLIFWVISNVSTAFYPLQLAAGFYKYGYAWPMYNLVEGSRGIIFGLYGDIGLNFGVLLSWTAISIILFPFCAHFARWKMQRAKGQETEKKLRKERLLEDSERRRRERERFDNGDTYVIVSL